MQNKNLTVPPLLKHFIFLILLISAQPVLAKELSTEDQVKAFNEAIPNQIQEGINARFDDMPEEQKRLNDKS